MSNIGKNIKKIRKVKGLNQSEFAEIFNVKRANIGSYEEQRAEPKLNLIIAIAEHFNISIDKLIKTNLTVNDILHFPSSHEVTSLSPQLAVNSKLKLKQYDLIIKNDSNDLEQFGINKGCLLLLNNINFSTVPFLGMINCNNSTEFRVIAPFNQNSRFLFTSSTSFDKTFPPLEIDNETSIYRIKGYLCTEVSSPVSLSLLNFHQETK